MTDQALCALLNRNGAGVWEIVAAVHIEELSAALATAEAERDTLREQVTAANERWEKLKAWLKPEDGEPVQRQEMGCLGLSYMRSLEDEARQKGTHD